MKRLIPFLIAVIFLLALSACDNSKSKLNSISTAELTDRENAIISTTSDKSFVFDFNIDEDYEEVSVWIEKYQSGKLMGEKISSITSEVKKNGSIIFTTSKTNDGQKEHSFNIGISSNGSIASISGVDSKSGELADMSSVWGTFQGENTLIEGEVVLASICYSNDDSMASLTTDFYKDVDGHLSELEDYDVAYILRAEFIK
jgi:hypothetical protein